MGTDILTPSTPSFDLHSYGTINLGSQSPEPQNTIRPVTTVTIVVPGGNHSGDWPRSCMIETTRLGKTISWHRYIDYRLELIP